MVDPAAILAIIRPIDAAAALICNEIDKVLELKPEEQPALEGLRKGVEKLKSGLVAFNVLLSATRVDPGFTVVLYVRWLRSTHMLKVLIIHNITERAKRKE